MWYSYWSSGGGGVTFNCSVNYTSTTAGVKKERYVSIKSFGTDLVDSRGFKKDLEFDSNP